MTITASTTSTTTHGAESPDSAPGSRGSGSPTCLNIPSDALIAGLKFVLPAMANPKDVNGLDVVWVSPGPVWKGWSRDWEPQWGGDGINLMCTDRFRLHVVGIECRVPDFPTMSMRGAQAAAALKMAPKPTKYGGVLDAAIKVVAPLSAMIEWPFGASVPVDLTGRDMPSIKSLLNLGGDTPEVTTGFTPKYLSDALMAFHQVKGGHPIRMRTSHNGKPVAVASADLEDTRSCLIMPVRLPA